MMNNAGIAGNEKQRGIPPKNQSTFHLSPFTFQLSPFTSPLPVCPPKHATLPPSSRSSRLAKTNSERSS
jgi:hypothetical protein